jgi:hypothetical protein
VVGILVFVDIVVVGVEGVVAKVVVEDLVVEVLVRDVALDVDTIVAAVVVVVNFCPLVVISDNSILSEVVAVKTLTVVWGSTIASLSTFSRSLRR